MGLLPTDSRCRHVCRRMAVSGPSASGSFRPIADIRHSGRTGV